MTMREVYREWMRGCTVSQFRPLRKDGGGPWLCRECTWAALHAAVRAIRNGRI